MNCTKILIGLKAELTYTAVVRAQNRAITSLWSGGAGGAELLDGDGGDEVADEGCLLGGWPAQRERMMPAVALSPAPTTSMGPDTGMPGTIACSFLKSPECRRDQGS